MRKKFISLFTMVAFIIFSLSCYSTKNIRLDAAQKVKKGEILRVVMTSGETIEFSRRQPARISNDRIEGVAIKVTGVIEIDRSNIERIEREKGGKFLIIITKDGKAYKDFKGTVTEEKDKYIFNGTFKMSSVSIPLSEVEMIGVKKFELYGAFLVFLGVVLVVVALVAESMSGPCTVYPRGPS